MSEQAKIDLNPSNHLSKLKQKCLSAYQHLNETLTISQKLYLVALLYLLFLMQDEVSVFDGLTLTGFIALAAVFTEVWPKFVKVWETLLGRIFIVLFYAIIANLAVAFAAQKVNQVVGIDPSPLFYTLGFTTILLAPLWFLGFTVVSMLIYMIFLQLWLITVFLLKLIRVPIYRDRSKSKLSYPILTNVVRVILIPVMLSFLGAVSEFYVGAVDYNFSNVAPKLSVSQDEQDVSNLESKSVEALADNDPRILNQMINEIAQDFKTDLEKKGTKAESSLTPEALAETESKQADSLDEDTKVLSLIAWFVHNIETFEHSQCVKDNNERAVFVGETDILLSKENPVAPFGYEFSVRVCELVDKT